MWHGLIAFVFGLVFLVNAQPVARASDLHYTAITPVNDESRYTTLNPQAELTEFDKVKHSKGNIVFTKGQRITGDRLILNHYDGESFTITADIEVYMKYPSSSATGATLTSIEIYVDMSADDASAYMITGGIGKANAEILLACNQTRTFVYETYFYGY